MRATSRMPGVAVDIGSSSLKVATIEASRGGLRLGALGVAPSPEEGVAEGVVVNPEEVAGALRQLISASGVTTNQAIAAVAGPRVVVRPIKFPDMPTSRLARAIEYESQRYIPFPVSEAVVQFQVVGERGPDGQIDVVLVAAHKETVESRVQTLELAGLEPLILDTESFAALRALIYASTDPEMGEAVVVILRMGSDFTEITLVQHGCFVLSRIIPLGGRAFSQSIAKSLGVELAEADRLRETVGVAVSGDELNNLAQEQRQVAAALASPLEELSKEIRRSLTYFLTQISEDASEAVIDQILLCGGGGKLSGLDTFLSSQIGAQVKRVNVFDSIAVDTTTFEPEFLGELAPEMVVTIGLALTPFVQDGSYPFSYDISKSGVIVRAGA